VQQDRYRRSCGQELQPEDRFCASCGKPVHATATVPTPEADVPIPPPPQQAQDSSVPSQAPQTQSSEEQVRSATRGPMWGMLAVSLVMGIGVPVRQIPAWAASMDIGSLISTGLVLGTVSLFIPATLILLFGGVYYVMARKDGVTFSEAIFNWPLVIVASIVAFVSLLTS
jgi:hypothetical protein